MKLQIKCTNINREFDAIEIANEYDLFEYVEAIYNALPERVQNALVDNGIDLLTDDVWQVLNVEYGFNLEDDIEEDADDYADSYYNLDEINNFVNLMNDYNDDEDKNLQLSCYITDYCYKNFLEAIDDFDGSRTEYQVYKYDSMELMAEDFITDGKYGNELCQVYLEHPEYVNLDAIIEEIETDFSENSFFDSCYYYEK